MQAKGREFNKIWQEVKNWKKSDAKTRKRKNGDKTSASSNKQKRRKKEETEADEDTPNDTHTHKRQLEDDSTRDRASKKAKRSVEPEIDPSKIMTRKFIVIGKKVRNEDIKSEFERILSAELKPTIELLNMTKLSREAIQVSISSSMSEKLVWHLQNTKYSIPFHIKFQTQTYAESQDFRLPEDAKVKLTFCLRGPSDMEGYAKVRIKIAEVMGERWLETIASMIITPNTKVDHTYICKAWTYDPVRMARELHRVRAINNGSSKSRWRAVAYGRYRRARHLRNTDGSLKKMDITHQNRYGALRPENGTVADTNNTHPDRQAIIDIHRRKEWLDDDDEIQEDNDIYDEIRKSFAEGKSRLKEIKGIKVASFNADRIGEQDTEIEQYCMAENIHIMCIQETGETNKFNAPYFENYRWYSNVCETRRLKGHHSVGIMVRNTIKVENITKKMPNPRCTVFVKVQTHESKKSGFVVGTYYIPCDNQTKGNKTKRGRVKSGIRSNVKYLRKQYGQDCKMLLCGDFNLHIGRKLEDETNILFGNNNFEEECDEDGEFMRKLIKELDIPCLNGRKQEYDTDGKTGHTLVTKKDKTKRSTHLMISNCKCSPMQITMNKPKKSDHNVLYTIIDTKVQFKPNKENKTRALKTKSMYDHTDPKSTNKKDIEHRRKVESNVQKIIDYLEEMGYHDKVAMTCECLDPVKADRLHTAMLRDAIKAICGTRRKGGGKIKSWWNDEYGKLWKEVRELATRVRRDKKSKKHKKKLKEKRKELRRMKNRLIRAFKKEQGARYAEMYRNNDKRIYQLHDELNKYHSDLNIAALIDKKDNNRLKSSIKDLLQIMENHGRKLFQTKREKEDVGGFVPLQPEKPTNYELLKEIKLKDVIKCIDDSSAGKAPGPEDGINAEVYIAPALHKIFNCVLTTGIVPPIWRLGTIVNLYKKKGSKTDPDNYRGIMLLSIAGKMFNSILAQRITKHCTKWKVLNDQQDGF